VQQQKWQTEQRNENCGKHLKDRGFGAVVTVTVSVSAEVSITHDPAHNDNDNDNDNGNDNNNDNDDFTADYNRSRWRRIAKYTRSVLFLLSACVLDLTSATNASVVSKAARTALTILAYAWVYTPYTGQLLWAIAYLMDHGWYLLAVTCSVVLLLGCGVLLVLLEWMWRWRERCWALLSFRGSGGNGNGNDSTGFGDSLQSNSNSNLYLYDRMPFRSVRVLDDDEMEDDWTLRKWIRTIAKWLVVCGVWALFCALNIRIDFWITDRYKEARQEYHPLELRLVNGFEGVPILVGAALLYACACPVLFRTRLSLSLSFVSLLRTDRGGRLDGGENDNGNDNGNGNFGYNDNDNDNGGMPLFVVEETVDFDHDNYTIAIGGDDEVGIGRGMQSLII